MSVRFFLHKSLYINNSMTTIILLYGDLGPKRIQYSLLWLIFLALKDLISILLKHWNTFHQIVEWWLDVLTGCVNLALTTLLPCRWNWVFLEITLKFNVLHLITQVIKSTSKLNNDNLKQELFSIYRLFKTRSCGHLLSIQAVYGT